MGEYLCSRYTVLSQISGIRRATDLNPWPYLGKTRSCGKFCGWALDRGVQGSSWSQGKPRKSRDPHQEPAALVREADTARALPGATMGDLMALGSTSELERCGGMERAQQFVQQGA